ncbi:MAG: TfoX/Sxy family protein [Verrucomicrobia bacterium]|nr:TfoX/Sxy family protein [Verrucomicrobiota bacterium]
MATDSFKDFVLDQLSGLPRLRAKAMFGGYGLYQGDRFFGILMDGRLYFRTDAQSRSAFVKLGMGPFVYEKARQIVAMNYYEVPPAVLENRDEIVAWATRSIQCAATSRRKSPRSRKAPEA